MQMQWLYLAAALVVAGGLAALAIWAARRYVKAEEPVELEVVVDDPLPATFVPPRPAPKVEAPPPPPASPRVHPERAPAMVLTHGVAMQDANFSRAPASRAPAPAGRSPPPAIPQRAPAPRPPMREPPPMKTWAQQVMEETKSEVPTEWARRQVGPVGPGRTAGACGGCGARLSVSSQRPVRIACPVCGRTKLLAA